MSASFAGNDFCYHLLCFAGRRLRKEPEHDVTAGPDSGIHHYVRSLQGIETTIYVDDAVPASSGASCCSLMAGGPVLGSFLHVFGYTDHAIEAIDDLIASDVPRTSFVEALASQGMPVLEAGWIFDNAGN